MSEECLGALSVCGSQKVEEHSVPGKNLHEALKRLKSNMLMCQESMAEQMVVSDEETTEKKNHDEETGDADSPRKAYRQLGDDEAMALDETFIIALEYRLPIHRLAMLLSDSQNNKIHTSTMGICCLGCKVIVMMTETCLERVKWSKLEEIGINATICAPHMRATCLQLLGKKNLQLGMHALIIGSGVCGSQKVEEHSVPGKNLHEALKRMKSNMLMCQESMAEKMVVSDEETTEKKNHDEETSDADHQGKRLAMLLSDSQNNKGKDATYNDFEYRLHNISESVCFVKNQFCISIGSTICKVYDLEAAWKMFGGMSQDKVDGQAPHYFGMFLKAKSCMPERMKLKQEAKSPSVAGDLSVEE
ncbi:hypothetical protein Tco_0704324 [Tanacetum coccineum]|uniref:Uncharacterized protein n=1 Tax=Tanacetum coccineum TaxID=301880 RepID=A0ABQ4Y314_9ASTR